MFQVINQQAPKSGFISMSDMKPGQLARVVELNSMYCDHILFRTLDPENFEVINLTKYSTGGYWNSPNALQVSLLPPDQKVIVEFYN